MRDYAKVLPKFWSGETCKVLRKRGPEGVIVALYLMSAPGSNMLGLYYQPILFMAHETGLGLEGVRKGLADCIAVKFCEYDEDSEIVWVFEMAAFQIAALLKENDNRCVGIQRDYDALPFNPFLSRFFDRYELAFHLKNKRGGEGGRKPLLSQEQEQEQEQEHEQDHQSSLRSDSSSPDGDDLPDEPGKLELKAPNDKPDRKASKADRIRQIAEEARVAYNAILAKPHGLLVGCTLLNKDRLKAVESCLPTARAMCQRLYGSERVTPEFWDQYFGEASSDDWHSGRKSGGQGHENWKPDFEYLLRENVMAKLFDRAMTEAE